MVEFIFEVDAGEGKMVMGPQEMPVSVKRSSPVLSDGAGLEIPVSTLPLAEGYRATVSQFDMLGAKSMPMLLTVNGMEKILVAAGGFDAYKVGDHSKGW